MSSESLLNNRIEDSSDEDIPILIKQHHSPLKKKFISLLVFLLTCIANVGISWCSDTPSSLQEQIISLMDLSVVKFYTFYSVYSIPNIVLVLVGGIMVDRTIGMRSSTIIFSAFVTIGQFFFALGLYYKSFNLMVFGRFVFGIGSESLSLALNKYLVVWYDSKYIALVFSFFMGVLRMVAFTMFNVTPIVYNYFKTSSTTESQLTASICVILLGFFLCFIGFVTSILLYYLDITYRSPFDCETSNDNAWNNLKTDFRSLNLSFWIMSFVCLFSYSGISPISGQLIIYLKTKYHFDTVNSNFALSLSSLIGAGASPIVGFLVGKTGHDILWLQLSLIGLVLAISLWLFSFTSPFVILSMNGIVGTLLSCVLWPMVSFIVPHSKIGTAYGVMQCLQNLGLAISPLIAGVICDNFGFFCFFLYMAGVVGMSLIFNAWLVLVDLKNQSILILTPSKRSELMARKLNTD